MTRSAPPTSALEPAPSRAPRHSVQRLVRCSRRHASCLSSINSQPGDTEAEQHCHDAVDSGPNRADALDAVSRPADHVIRKMNDNSGSRPKHATKPAKEKERRKNQSADLDGGET